ncbi:hypothetical protein ACFQFQ_17345 [Sulfitobacter porphyrae]|uniref:CDP-alcohol phosphatidyltransferase family protein n=1 Tax=Sulfitobacter porphyrae TaxID=1246864 RepID=A0ABW2B6N6_9RHOB
MTDLKNRRPLQSRKSGWANRITAFLAGRAITPNQISQASIAAALLAGLAFWMTAYADSTNLKGALLILAALTCQLRLLCNLFDGMVAIEAKKARPTGRSGMNFRTVSQISSSSSASDLALAPPPSVLPQPHVPS